MEDRLRRNQPGRTGIQVNTNQTSTQQRTETINKDDSKPRSRPGTARATQQAPSSGNMPPTPGASEGEYHIVTRDDLYHAAR